MLNIECKVAFAPPCMYMLHCFGGECYEVNY